MPPQADSIISVMIFRFRLKKKKMVSDFIEQRMILSQFQYLEKKTYTEDGYVWFNLTGQVGETA